MDRNFWISAWNEGRTAFHREDFHDKLLEYFPLLNPAKGQRVLVPLCGKTKDLLWLRSLGLNVHGVELSEQAAEAFFKENELSPVQTTRNDRFVRRTFDGITLSCGDFFDLGEESAYDLIYDRAALVALPAPLRRKYAQVIEKALRPGGKCLLIAYEYNQSEMEGPPFSVDANEIEALYGAHFSIHRKESHRPANEGPRLSAVKALNQTVYVLEK